MGADVKTDYAAEIAKRCAAVRGPDRAIDAMIWIAEDPDGQWIVGEKEGCFPRDPIYGPRSSLWDWASGPQGAALDVSAPRYTGSLDAALSIVPERRLIYVWKEALSALQLGAEIENLPSIICAAEMLQRT